MTITIEIPDGIITELDNAPFHNTHQRERLTGTIIDAVRFGAAERAEYGTHILTCRGCGCPAERRADVFWDVPSQQWQPYEVDEECQYCNSRQGCHWNRCNLKFEDKWYSIS